MSKYEDVIVNILKKEHIRFVREKTFLDLKGGRYRFDFYLTDYNIIIEVDGEQHFRQVNLYQKTKSDFLKTQEHDRRKNSYCLANQIPLYRIPYWEIINIKSLQDIIKYKFRVQNKWHNDRLKIPENF